MTGVGGRIGPRIAAWGLAMGASIGASAGELDVVPWARLQVNGIDADAIWLHHEAAVGRAALRDGDPATAWHPPADAAPVLRVDASTVAGLTFWPTRLEIDGADGAPPPAPAAMRWGAGPLSLAPLGFDDDGADGTTARWSLQPEAAGCVLELTFEPGASAIAAVRLSVADAATPERLPVVDAAAHEVGGVVELRWDADADAAVWLYRVERSEAGGWRALGETRAGRWLDRPPASPARYRVTGIGASGAAGPAAETEVSLTPAVADPARGVVEGFYGAPWSHAVRRELIRLQGVAGMGLYVYGPKDDPLHRAQWRTPYDDDARARFAELRAVGEGVGVTVAMGISPGLDMATDDPDERALLVAKLQPLLDDGFRAVALLMDDIPTDPSADVGAAHAALANALAAALDEGAGEPVALSFVPTVYRGTAASLDADARAYLEALGAALDPGIPIAWTGEDTFDVEIEAAEADGVAAVLGRPPLLWDNYPVNDQEVLRRDLFLGAPQGRDGDLLAAIDGLWVNPMVEGLASLPAILGYAALARAPEQYDAADALHAATRWLAPDDDGAALLAEIAAHHAHNPHVLPDEVDSAALLDATTAFAGAVTGGAGDAIGEAAWDAARALAAAATLHARAERTLADPRLADELDAPLATLADAADAGLARLEALQLRRAGIDGDRLERADAEAERAWEAAVARHWDTGLDAVQPLRAVDDPGPAAGAAAPPELLGVAAEREGRVGEPLTVEIAVAVDALEVVGVAGARIDEGAITWIPQRPGSYRLVVLAGGDGAVGARAIDVRVGRAAAPPDEAGGCACTAPGSSSPAGAGGGIALALGAAAVVARRRVGRRAGDRTGGRG